jgi:hypothetical protein
MVWPCFKNEQREYPKEDFEYGVKIKIPKRMGTMPNIDLATFTGYAVVGNAHITVLPRTPTSSHEAAGISAEVAPARTLP